MKTLPALGIAGMAVLWLMAVMSPSHDQPDDLAHQAPTASAPDPEDVRLYREAVAEVEARAHARGLTVAEYAESIGTDSQHAIGLTFAAKKIRSQAEATDRKIYGQ